MSRILIFLLLVSSVAQAGHHSDPALDPSKEKHALPSKMIPQRSVAFSSIPLTEARKFLNYEMADYSLPYLFYGSPKLPTYQSVLARNPKAFDILKANAFKRAPGTNHSPTLVNSDYEFSGISDREFGYCWGFATVIRNFTYLASFDKNSIDKNMPDRKSNHEKWLRYYYKRIDLILKGHAVVIPEFANFREFTAVPEFEVYLKFAAMFLWKERAIRSENLPIFFNATTLMTKAQLDATAANLKTKLARGEFPKILFSAAVATQNIFGGSGNIHVVLVHEVENRTDGSTRIHVWDVNYYGEDLAHRKLYLEITAAGLVTYDAWFSDKDPVNSTRIARIELTPEDEMETAIILKGASQLSRRHRSTTPLND